MHVETLWHSYTRELSITSLPGASLSQTSSRYLLSYQAFMNTGEPAIIDGAYGYYFPTADFVVQSMGVEQAREALKSWKRQ